VEVCGAVDVVMTYETGARRLVNQLTTLDTSKTSRVLLQHSRHSFQHVAVKNRPTTPHTYRHYRLSPSSNNICLVSSRKSVLKCTN